jgi:GTPase SAR1 family protein
VARTRKDSSEGRSASRRTARSSPADLPRVPRTFDMQAESRHLLDEALAPWLVTRWEQNDFGVDAAVEITDPVTGTGDREATGRLFGVQLKATESADEPTSLSVTTGHLRYWLQHSLPMLLVSAHLPSGRLRGRWIDDALRLELRDRSPTFWSQDTVTVPLSLPVEQATRETVQRVVTRFKARDRHLNPGDFFNLRKRVLAAADELEGIASGSDVQSATLAVTEARSRMRAAAYLVAVAGPQRVGKSTLVNALLGVSVSPVADYPTTAVPLLFDAGNAVGAEVAFADRRIVRVEASADALRPYAAQQENDANDKRVRLIRVTLPNDMLSKGVSLLDTPGLHDASELVRDVTDRALKDADAVLYVLDASLDKKFKLGRAEIEDLQALRHSKERLIVVLNQADGLDLDGRDRLLQYVQAQLRKYSVWDDLPAEPIFVSAANAWAARSAGQQPPGDFTDLEDLVWGHLLRNRATGMHRLVHAVHQLAEGTESVAEMLSSRASKGSEASEIEAARAVCDAARSAVTREVERWRLQRRQEVAAFLRARTEFWLSQLRAELRQAQTIDHLPKGAALAERLRGQLGTDGNEAIDWLRRGVDDLTQAVGGRVRAALRESRGHLGLPPELTVVVPLPQILPPVDLSLPEAGLGFLGGLIGFLVNPGVGILTTIFGWVFGHGIAVKERMKKAIVDIEGLYTKAQREHYAYLEHQALQRVDAAADSVLVQATGKLDTFIHDAAKRVERLGRPLSEREVAELSDLVASARQLRGRLIAIHGELAALVDVDA